MHTTASVVYGLVLLLLARSLNSRKMTGYAMFLVVVTIAGLAYGLLQDLGLWDNLVRRLPT